jgi:aminoglycoside 3-N-acetyltransferase
MNPTDIKKILSQSGIKKGDTLMLHGDAGISTSIISNKKNKLDIIFNEIIDYLGNKGTILIPTFTYNFCDNKNFNIKKTKSQLGLFSETFRLKKNIKRTSHPIFSFAIYGNKSDYYLNASIKTCFGKNSIFEFLKKDKGKISCLGCSFYRVTFIHHIEQSFGVDYRYIKKFKGNILYENKKKPIATEYFVRNLNQSVHLNLELLYKYLKKEKNLFEVDFGRYNLITTQSNFLFNAGIELLKKNKYALIEEKYL